MRWCSVLCATKSLKASAVVAKPPGTDTPRPESSPIISPSEEFLPPTWARSVSRRSCSHRMLLLEARALKTGTPGCAGGGGNGEGQAQPAEVGYFSRQSGEAAMIRPASTCRRRGRSRGIPTGKRLRMSDTRPVFYVSDGTGITAETIGHSLLTQFADTRFSTDRIPFVDSPERAREAAARIRAKAEEAGVRPVVVSSCVDPELTRLIGESGALVLDIFAPFIEPMERELGQQRKSQVGQAHGMVDFETYHARINAMNYALTHDDGIAIN